MGAGCSTMWGVGGSQLTQLALNERGGGGLAPGCGAC